MNTNLPFLYKFLQKKTIIEAMLQMIEDGLTERRKLFIFLTNELIEQEEKQRDGGQLFDDDLL